MNISGARAIGAGLVLAALFGADDAPAQISVGPDIRTTPSAAGRALPAVVRFRAGPARCGGEEQRPLAAEEPFPNGVMAPPPIGSRFALWFRIDPSGRPLGISHERSPIPGYGVFDVPAAFAAWRFAPGAERRDCTIVFTPVTETVAAATLETLYRFLALQPLSGQPRIDEVGRPAFRRARPVGSDCYAPPRNVRLQAFPPFDEMQQPAGTYGFSFVAHDIRADGRPRSVRLVASSGNRTLDREAIAAVSRSRFQPGTRTGCLQHYFLRPSVPMHAPPPPEESAFRPDEATCPEDAPDFVAMPALVFPSAFQLRAIEGWAVLSYDLAPWGQTGNVRVLAAEPASAFGDEAARIVTGARTAGGGSGYTGCTVRVIFRMPRPDEEPPEG